MSAASPYNLIPNPPSEGPLKEYRENKSFDWKKLKIYIEGEKECLYKLKMFTSCLQHAEFHNKSSEMSNNNELLHTYKQLRITKQTTPFTERAVTATAVAFLNMEILSSFDCGLMIKRTMAHEMMAYLLKEANNNSYEEIKPLLKNDLYTSCIALTEIGHGSNLQRLQTTATYDIKSEAFILNTPSEEAWKCWSGNLGVTATYAMVLAQLYTPDEKCHGLHWFFVPIRNPSTMKPYPGILVGNMGRKIGLNNVDNGFMAFNNYKVPRKALLSRFGHVNIDGEYVTSIPDRRRRFSYLAGNLNVTRLGIAVLSMVCLKKGIVIAVRYAAVRKQFGPDKDQEVKLLDYPLHQLRLMPYLSVCFVLQVTMRSFIERLCEHGEQINPPDSNSKGIHLLIISIKVLTTWTTRNALQEIREACGGHGYLAASGIGDLRNVNDSFVTLEGDNNVLLQQVSRILMSSCQAKMEGKPVECGYQLFSFLDSIDQILQQKCNTITHLFTPDGLLQAFDYLLCYLLNAAISIMRNQLEGGRSMFEAFAHVHTSHGKQVATIFTEVVTLRQYFQHIHTTQPPADSSLILNNMGMLFGLRSLQSHLLVLCKAQYIKISDIDIINSKVYELCSMIKVDAVVLADVLAPPDECLNSVLGCSDGEVYKRLVHSFLNDGDHLTRPSWWELMCSKPVLSHL